MALSAGSIAFTGYNGDGNDNLSFVALTDIPQGTVINFSDSNWSGSSFASGSSSESTMAWTATSAIAAGTVIDINNIGSGTLGASAGSVVFTNTNNTGLSNDSEVVYAYIGTAATPTFLAAISNIGFATSDGTLTGTGLVAGQTAIGFAGGLDIMGYNGPRTGLASFADYLAAINNTANWLTQNGSGNQSTDGTAPDAPFPTTVFSVAAPAAQTLSFSPASVSVVEGDSGTKTLTFTITRSGGTTGAVSFSGSFDAGSTDASDFGGTLPASSFSGSIAAGASSATITITISGDTTAESNESFTLTLTSASNPNATVTIGTATATGTITNDDGSVISGNSTTPITLANNDHVTLASGATLSGSTPVTWIGGSTSPGAVLDNLGTITGSSRAIYTSGSTGGSFTVNNAVGATITAVKDAIKISNLVSGTSGTFTINNDGTISSTGTAGNAGQALDLDDIASATVNTVINNSATGVIQAADADAIRGGTNATINNYGRITSLNGTSTSTGNDAIDFQTVNSGGVVNNFAGGIIDGARHGITGKQPITVNNSGSITGEAGSGINLDTAGDTVTTVVNRGTITGKVVNGADADGIDVDGLLALDNYGTISAVGLTTGGLNEGLAIGGGNVYNRAGATIVSDQRAITVDDSNEGSAFGSLILNNDGTIQGKNGEAISIKGSFVDTISNTGRIIGSVFTDGGDDVFNAYVGSSVSGIIDLGTGNDTVNLLAMPGTATGSIGQVVNVETMNVVSGKWVMDYFFSGANLNVRDGATIATAISLTGGQTLTVDQGGSLFGTKTVIWVGGGNVDAIVNNNGLIRVTAAAGADKADAISMNGGTATIHNGSTGFIDGARHAITGPLGIHVINDAGGVIVGRNGSAVNMDNSPIVAYTAYVDNYGTMLGDSANIGDSDGDAVDVDGFAVINNWGSIRGEGANGYHKGEANVSEGIAIGGGTVHNYAGGNIYGYGRAIEVDNSSNAAAFSSTTIINEGIIEGGGHGPTNVAQADIDLFAGRIKGGEAINIIGSYADTITNSGAIFGGVKTDGGDDVMSNSGMVVAKGGSAVNLGDGNDTFTNTGTVSGDVLLGAGNDTINIATGSTITGTIDGGDGVDTLNLQGSGNGGTLGAISNVETIDVQGGTWAVGDTSAATIVESGASLIVNGAVSASTVAAGGTEYVYGSVTGSTVSGAQLIASGATVTTATINAGGDQTIYDGGNATGTTIAGGSQTVWGSADQTSVEDGGVQYVHGSVTDSTVDAGGTQLVYGAGTSTGTIVNTGGTQIDAGLSFGTVVDGGTQIVYGTAVNTSVNAGGIQHVSAGSSANDTTIGSGGTEYVHTGGNAHDVNFAGPNATLILDQHNDLTGFISGWQFGDVIDFGDISFGENTSVGYAENTDHTGGTLTVSDGTHTATLALLGQYTASDFALSSDGHGGTVLTDPTDNGAQVQNLLAPAHAA